MGMKDACNPKRRMWWSKLVLGVNIRLGANARATISLRTPRGEGRKAIITTLTLVPARNTAARRKLPIEADAEGR